MDGVSAERLTESGSSCTSGIDDGGDIGAIAAGSSLRRFTGQLIRTCGRGRCYTMMV